MKKNNKGITLIALVVTIVVLLILAGITISLILNDDGIIAKAREAKNATETSVAEEQKKLSDLDKILDDSLGPPKADDDTPGSLDGDGTEDSPYRISSIEDLVTFSNEVNSGNSYSGKVLVLNNNLDFTSNSSYVNPNTTEFGDINEDSTVSPLKVELTTGKGFKPIGSFEDINYSFAGTLDGQGYYIKGYNMEVPEDSFSENSSIFGLNTGTIKNLDIGDITINSTPSDSFCNVSISGICYANIGTIENCNLIGEVSIGDNGILFFSGITSYNEGTIYNCSNKSIVDIESSKDVTISGISMENSKDILLSNNQGSISSRITSENTSSRIQTRAAISSRMNISGISDYNTGEINGCYNSGNISASASYSTVNGIANSNQGNIFNSYNSGTLYASGDDTFICGIVYENYGNSYNCYNVGDTSVESTYFSNQGFDITKGLSISTSNNVTNCYYLEGVSDEEKYTSEMGMPATSALELSSDNMKTDSFVNRLNQDVDSSYSIKFVKDTSNINDGYPILSEE